ncbi:unnamed protein product [Mytilus coruscus]|uniref:RNase H type-1 domain-containing protein n=1 Tax=Mytilus coruscus TaxID=42192 RepID=A0A6J8B711_MYTCO|nr:unnamed protein product [Mytilus coruscus]
MLDNIDIAVDCIEHQRYEKAVKVLKESSKSLKKRNKLIRIADKYEGGWQTVEYLSDDVASDSEDDKRIWAADDRAVKKLKTMKQDKRQNIKKRATESAGGPSSIAHNGNNGGFSQQQPLLVCMDIGPKTVKKGEIQQLPEEHHIERSPDILKVQNVDNFDSFYDYESVTSSINVKNRLKNSLDFWRNINASKFILDLIENGYKIPLINEPESVLLRNNKDFVEKAVQELIDASLIKELLKVKIRLLAKLCGKIISFSPAIGNVTQIMTRCTFSVINLKQDWDQYVDLRHHSDSIQEILFWKQNIHCLKPVPVLRNNSEFNVFTDASDIGAGGYLQGTDYIANRQWSVTEATKSSTWREVKAIELSLDSLAKVLEHSSVTFFKDNQNAVSIIKKGSKSPHLQGLALSIFNTCVSCNISLYAQWIPREENEKADALSRIIDIDDWGISFKFFHFLNSIWGPFTVDRFANMHNTKPTRFNSKYWNPTTSAIDAFTCNWHGENNWLVQPISLVSNCINHLVSCGAEGTLIVPKWQSAAFWPLIFKQNLEYACYVVDVLEFHEVERIFVAGNNLNSLFANGKFHGKVLAVHLNALVV